MMHEFATGDCCCEDVSGLVVTGRAVESGVVKVLGRRVACDAIRRVFEECPQVIQAWVCSLETGVGVLCNTNPGVTETDVRRWVSEHKPQFRLPYALRCCSLASTQKVSQKRVVSFFSTPPSSKALQLSSPSSSPSSPSSHTSTSQSTSPSQSQSQTTSQVTLTKLVHLFESALSHEINPQEDFFLVGGDSLKALVLLESLHHVGIVSCSLMDLYSHPSPIALWNFIYKSPSTVTTTPTPTHMPPITATPTSIPSHWTEMACIPFKRCVDCDCVVLAPNSACCCCHGGWLKKITLDSGAHSVKEDFVMKLQERIEKSLAVYAGKTLVVGAYSGYVLFIDIQSQTIQKKRVAGEIRARMGIAGTTGVLCTYSGRVYFFDLEAKQLLGSAFLGVNCHTTPWVVHGANGCVTAVCASINSIVLVVQLKAGRVEVLQRWDVGEPIFSEPVAVGNEIMMVTVKGKKVMLRLEKMELKEAVLDVRGLVYAKPLVVSPTEFLLTTTEGELLRVDLTTNVVMERVKCGKAMLMSPLQVGNGEYIVCSSSGIVYSVVKGKADVVYSCSGAIFSNPIFLNDCILFGCRDDKLIILQYRLAVCFEISLKLRVFLSRFRCTGNYPERRKTMSTVFAIDLGDTSMRIAHWKESSLKEIASSADVIVNDYQKTCSPLRRIMIITRSVSLVLKRGSVLVSSHGVINVSFV